MARVVFTHAIQRHVPCPPVTIAGATVREALDVDGTGDRLAFGTTTGSLFVTEDQGDSWQPVSAHLPPVYCVRFAR